MVIGLHGQAGVTARCLVVMDNRDDKERVINQSVEAKAVMAANIVPRLAIFYAKQNVSTLLQGTSNF